MKRLLTAGVLIVLVLAGVRWAPLWIFWLGLSAMGIVAAQEMGAMLGAGGRRPWPFLAGAGTVALIACFLLPDPPLAPTMTGLLFVLLLRFLFSPREPAVALERLLSSLLTVVYLGLTLGHVGGLLTAELPEGRETGEDLLIFALVVVYVGDSLAYYGGRAWGRHKLAPKISPAKTWEGAACSLVGSLLASLLAPLWFFQALPISHALGLGALLSVTGILGDLCESLLKRAAAVKDSGSLLPGHGGLLDRVDSLLLAAPVLYWYHRLVL
ncbi:MAG: phosphatidate cytidylyltransferase [Acidobacteriota bacterium]|nr:phosphatidate cytidylyltransferase [Acidobacteriota bacterium]MDQ7086772.1 phosphatidate cytidylyltransferase [Acidobacteriota bacterium]